MSELDNYFNQQRQQYLEHRRQQQQQADAEGVGLDQVQTRELRALKAAEESARQQRDAAALQHFREASAKEAERAAKQQRAREERVAQEAARIAASQAHWTAVTNGTWTPVPVVRSSYGAGN